MPSADQWEGQSVSIPVRRSRQVRAVSLDDLTSPDPTMERAFDRLRTEARTRQKQ